MKSFLIKNWLIFIILGSVILVEFLPFYLHSIQEREGLNLEIKATVIKVERNIFGNATAAQRLDEKSCTIYYEYQIDNQTFKQSYRSSCEKFWDLKQGALFDILVDSADRQKSLPKGIINNHNYLRNMTVIGIILFLMALLVLCLKLLSKRKVTINETSDG